jgi:hypothetical protein
MAQGAINSNNSVSHTNAVNQPQHHGNSVKSNFDDELRNGNIFSYAAKHPNANVQAGSYNS